MEPDVSWVFHFQVHLPPPSSVRLVTEKLGTTKVKGLSAIRKIFNLLLKYKNAFISITTYSSKNRINLTEKRLFMGFHSVGTGHCFSS